MRSVVASLLAVLSVLGAGGAFAGQLVIIDSTVPELASGQILDSSKPLNLGAGAQITVIGEDGKVTTLKGPYSGAPGGKAAPAGDTGLVASLSRLIEGQGKQSATLGVMRGLTRGVPPDAWVIDISRSGTHCVREGSVPRLWRRQASRAITLEIKVLPYGDKVSVDWAAGADALVWPDSVALKDGGGYLVKKAKGMTATRLTVRMVPPDFPSDAHRVVWMANKGCHRQAKTLLAGLI